MTKRDIKPRHYMGVTIYPCPINSSGMLWYARVGSGTTLRADTLSGIKLLIKQEKEHEKR